MDKKILLIVEGESDEVKFFRKLFNKCKNKTTYQIYSYKTNIHILAQELYNNYNDFDNGYTDIRYILASLEKDKKKKDLLQSTYSDIFMIFDFDPQHDHLHFDTIKRMTNYYNDSTDQGKLFINYPMMQSYKHFESLPCPNFEDLTISISDVADYKRIVANVSKYTDLEKYNYVVFYSITIQNLKKANKILKGVYKLPTPSEYLFYDLSKIFDYQVNLFANKKRISVLNTSIFVLIDFAPNAFFSFVENHKTELLIE